MRWRRRIAGEPGLGVQRRLRDQLDLQALLAVATEADLEDARKGVSLIVERGFHRGRALEADFGTLVRDGS